MAKNEATNETVHGYVHEPKLTANLENFVAWVMEAGEVELKTAKETEAFKHGLYVGIRSYSHYQAEKNAEKRSAKLAAATPVAPIRKPRAPRQNKVA